jgi:ribosomal protein S6
MNEDIKDSMQVYEVGFHLLPTVDESSLEGEVNVIKGLITKHGGEIIGESFPTLINLAYTITKLIGTNNKDFDKAYFGSIKFEVARNEIEAISKAVVINPNILRSIIVKTVKENTLYYAKDQRANKDNDSVVQDDVIDIDVAKTTDVDLDKSIDDLIVA